MDWETCEMTKRLDEAFQNIKKNRFGIKDGKDKI